MAHSPFSLPACRDFVDCCFIFDFSFFPLHVYTTEALFSLEVYNFLKQQCGGETLYSELAAGILEELFSANILAKKLLYPVYDRVGHTKQQQFRNATMRTMKSDICSPKDAVCLISELSMSMNKYQSLVRYTNSTKRKSLSPSLRCFLARRWWILRGKKCYWPLERSTHHGLTLKKSFWGFPGTLLIHWNTWPTRNASGRLWTPVRNSAFLFVAMVPPVVVDRWHIGVLLC